MCITRCILRWGLISALAVGGLAVLAPDHTAACFSMIRGKAQNAMDNFVSDPVALRHQLEGLSKEYPDRIAEVRGEIAEVDHQIGQFSRDIAIAQRVVAMTSKDLDELGTLVARAEESVKSTSRPVSIRYAGTKLNLDEAYNEGRRIQHVRTTYGDRQAHDQQQLTFLTQQKQRLTEILNKLESEFSTFQAQLWALDRQIDAIERNERLITLTEEQQATLASYEKFGKVGSLKQLEAKLAELRTKQEAQLQYLSKQGVNTDYENRAQMELNSKSWSSNPFDEPPGATEPTGNSSECDEQSADDTNKTLAFSQPIVIE
jgi:chromosome segregation ATPase